MSTVRIGYAQYDVHFGEYDRNLKTVTRLAEEGRDADLLVFPELGLTGYEFIDAKEVERFAEPAGAGPTADAIRKLAAEFNTTLVIGYPEYSTAGCYNAAMLVTPDGEVHNYRKMHLFSREKELFLPGNRPPDVVDTPAGRIGLMICFDWLFPEAARMLAVQGAQIIAHPSNLVLNYCQRAMYCRALENAVFIVTANRIGSEDRAGRTLAFTGQSQIVSPAGAYLSQAGADVEAVGMVEADTAEADDKHITEVNDRIADRRIELYGQLFRQEAAEIEPR
jgi:predicted amidohydrolase